ncbi:MCE family protein [Streptomyces polyrhachis]|uniref:MCE family protein n=1 Tax=Streptomyces polyrhachis TaxID=1282885 RepID=A0ABW2GDB6_9ACTN
MRRDAKTAFVGVAALALLASPIPIMVAFGESPEFSGIQDLPLPGGADLGSHPYEVTAEFENVQSLVPQSSVKVNDVAVGRVTDIDLADQGWTAVVTMKVNGGVRLPEGVYARIEQSSLLGEKYVQLVAPGKAGQLDAQPAAATSATGGREVDIPLARTNRNPEVEEVFGALSMLLNGGGIQQLRTISRELNKALEGNEPAVKSMLHRVDELMRSLDGNKKDITAALDSLNRLSTTLAVRKTEIGEVLTGLSPGLKVLKEQRGALMAMLKSLDRLSGTAVETINRSKDDMVADLRALAPILKNLADAGQALPDSLQVLLTYPFTDEVLSGVKGDYLNVYMKLAAQPGTQIIPPIKGGPITFPTTPPTSEGGEQPMRSPRRQGAPAPSAPSLPLPSVTTPQGGEG